MAQADVWQRALGDLADRYGRDVSDAWFCKLSFVGIGPVFVFYVHQLNL